MNAIDTLKAQHDEVMKRLATLDASKPGSERNITFKELNAQRQGRAAHRSRATLFENASHVLPPSFISTIGTSSS